MQPNAARTRTQPTCPRSAWCPGRGLRLCCRLLPQRGCRQPPGSPAAALHAHPAHPRPCPCPPSACASGGGAVQQVPARVPAAVGALKVRRGRLPSIQPPRPAQHAKCVSPASKPAGCVLALCCSRSPCVTRRCCRGPAPAPLLLHALPPLLQLFFFSTIKSASIYQDDVRCALSRWMQLFGRRPAKSQVWTASSRDRTSDLTLISAKDGKGLRRVLPLPGVKQELVSKHGQNCQDLVLGLAPQMQEVFE